MKRIPGLSLLVLAALAAGSLPAAAKPGAVVAAGSDVKWAEAGVPGVHTAVVSGDLAKGPSRFYLRYAAGLVTPMHHHNADHYGTTVAGTLLLTVDGKEHRLGPGSYFALTGKKPHMAKCDGDVDCVMFIEAKSPWDVVPEKEKK